MIIARVYITGIQIANRNYTYDGLTKSISVNSNLTQFNESMYIAYAVTTESGRIRRT